MKADRLEDVILRHLQGDLPAEELRELEEEILRNPDAARRLRELADEEVDIACMLGREDRSPVPRQVPRWPLRGLAAAAALLLVALAIRSLWPTAPQWLYEGSELFVIRAENLSGAGAPVPGERLLARSGVLRLQGATVRILAPTIFTVPRSGKPELSLEAGYLRLETDRDARGLIVRTEKGSLVDTGTVFEVRLNDNMEEQTMLAKTHAGSFPIFVLATVLTGQVSWQPLEGAEQVITPESGPVKLADDFSLGSISDREGVVLLKPILGERWTPVTEEVPVQRGDWIKAAARGANAAEISLTDGSKVILGPASLVELVEPGRLRVHSGEVEVRPAADAELVALGPGETRRTIREARVLRARDGELDVLDEEPRWLEGFKARESTEALGSLLANVDGRNVPLTIGYHKVTVDIRDQIARTVIEESFRNHTDDVLEGVFYFPLPQEASISGFGMWIGGELVEADIVEKQRAREIYEEILREKRDPGLLEWTGGSIFKARVYPIPAGGEKRIRIVYTQVLPKTGTAYRYTYALRSELLEQNPLRELQVDVNISSAESLAAVQCPSHPARIRKTDHAARVEFTAEEYTPRRDLEVLVETRPADGDVVFIPHRRGEDGYFMVLLSVPGSKDRGLVRSSEPLDLIVVADTSASMTDEQLREQRLFVASLLESLSEEDQFNLMAFDVKPEWCFDTPTPITPESRDAALDLLERRGALGWTDLDLAFEEVFARVRENTHVVYVGDGIITTGDADPAAFANRLKRAYRGKGSFHAVGVGSTYELLALRAVASLGGGSLHRTGGGKDAVEAARELLEEITSPGLRDLELEWEGLRVARVYPEVLPNLPEGRQQLLLGRYLPGRQGSKAVLRVRGKAGMETVAREVALELADADKGNSFIPRLWARMHLDHLLEQGASPEIRERIIALSESYQIITPYTSLLVLESDEDRERYGVKKRFRQRDGEEFFAEGRDDARYQLERQQMLRARLWRRGLQREILALYRNLGRDLGIHPTPSPYASVSYSRLSLGESNVWSLERDARVSSRLSRSRRNELWAADGAELCFPFPAGEELGWQELNAGFAGEMDEEPLGETGFESPAFDLNGNGIPASGRDFYLADDLLPVLGDSPDLGLASNKPMSLAQPVSAGLKARLPMDSRGLVFSDYDSYYGRFLRPAPPPPPLAEVFPRPGSPPEDFEGQWPQEVRELVERLDRRRTVRGLEGAIRVTVETDSIDFRERRRPGSRGTHLLSAGSWASGLQSHPGDITTLRWVHGGRRGVADLGRGLGSRREAEEGDARAFPAPFAAYFDDLEQIWTAYTPERVDEGDRTALKLVSRADPTLKIHVLVDRDRNAIVEVSHHHRGKKTSVQSFGDLVEVAGAWWPRVIEHRDADDRLTATTRVAYEALAGDAWMRALEDALVPLEETILLELPLPEVAEAKRRAAEGEASFEDRWVLMGHFSLTQEWEIVAEHHAAAERLAGGKRGLEWIRLVVLQASRRNDAVKDLTTQMARALAGAPVGGDYALASRLYQQAAGPLQAIEKLELLDLLKPVFERQDPALFAVKTWKEWRLQNLHGAGSSEERAALIEELAREYPWDTDAQTRLASQWAEQGEVERAVRQIEEAIERHGPWTEGEVSILKGHAANLLRNHRRLVEHLAYVDNWVRGKPETVGAWVLNQYLSSLVMLDREEEADARIAAWLEDARDEDPAPLDVARLEAAVAHALNQGADLYTYRRVDPRWREPLARVARDLAFGEQRGAIAGRILQYRHFYDCEEGRQVRKELYLRLAAESDELSPRVIQNLCNWLRSPMLVPSEGEPTWEDIARKLLELRLRSEEAAMRGILASTIISLGVRDVTLELRRRELAEAETDEQKGTAAWALFRLLLEGPWSPEVEREVFTLLSRIGSGEGRAAAQVVAVRHLVRQVEGKLVEKRSLEIPDRSQLTRRQLRPLEADARRKALEDLMGVIGRLESSGSDPTVAPFVKVEEATTEARLGKDPMGLFARVRSLLLEIPDSDEEDPLEAARDVLAERCARILGSLATRPEADDRLAGDLLELLDERIKEDSKRPDPKVHKYYLLVVLDRGDEVRKALETWAGEVGDVPANPWMVPLGTILAETGELSRAVEIFEKVERLDELGPREYGALAGWYQALDAREKHREAKIRVYMKSNEWQVAESLRRELGRYRRQGEEIPEELGEDVLLRFAAILRKASHPQNHTYLLRQYYEATKDFRLLETMPEAILGQTAAKIYPFLGSLDQVIRLIEDEATVDRIESHIRKLREGKRSAVDQRALFLLEFLVERRAADQAHGTGPHVAAALAALRGALREEYREGEPVLMAGFLASVGRLVEELRGEQLSELQRLHDAAAAGTEERFVIGGHRAAALWANERKQDAIEVVSAVLDEYREAHGGLLPPSANGTLSSLGSYLEGTGEYAKAEGLWRSEFALGHNEQQRRWLEIQLFTSLGNALRHEARTSLGSGGELYRSLRIEILAALEVPTDEWHARQLVDRLCDVFTTAHERKIGAAGADLKHFAYRGLPPVLDLYHYRLGQDMISRVSDRLRKHLGYPEELEFLVTRAETEPRWIERKGEDFWASHGWRLARARAEAGPLGSLEPRVLAVFLEEIRRDLTERQQRNRVGYTRNHSWFWGEKAGEFFEATVEVLEAHRDSEDHVKYIAAYLYHGLHRHPEAIEALLVSYRKAALGVDGRWQLVEYLHEQARFEESIAILQGLIEEMPGNVDYRPALMRAYHRTGRPEKLLATLQAAHEYFHAEGRWCEQPAAKLAFGCLDTELFEKSTGYYDEAIKFHTKSAPNRGVGDGTLSSYYGNLARAWAGLGNTAKAVDAAAGAIVSWGRDDDNRARAEEALRDILKSASALDGFVEAFEAELARSGLENPIVRKALGDVYLERKEYDKAAEQLTAAVESGPIDPPAMRKLIQALDAGGHPDDATARLRALARRKGHDLALFEELGKRLEKAERQDAAERAFTSLVEMSAHESEGEAMLARVRERQQRFQDAARAWRQVIRIRSREPQGYLGLAGALIRAGEDTEAREVLDTLLRETWHPRFGDVRWEARKLEKELR